LEIIETCNCLPAEAPDEVPLNKTSLPVCNTAKEAGSLNKTVDVYGKNFAIK
jgi:hypothetical protein